MSNGRIYSEKEALQLVQLAAKLQQDEPDSGHGVGISYEELERISKESGIDPKYLQLALERKQAGGSGHPGQEVERIVEGEVDPADFDVIYEVLGQSGNAPQQMVTQVGRSVQGMKMVPWGVANISISSRKGRTRISLRPIPAQTFMMTAFTPLLLAFQSLVFGTTFGISMGAWWIYLFAVPLLALAWWLHNFGRARCAKHLNDLADKLAVAVTTVAVKPESLAQTRAETLADNSAAGQTGLPDRLSLDQRPG